MRTVDARPSLEVTKRDLQLSVDIGKQDDLFFCRGVGLFDVQNQMPLRCGSCKERPTSHVNRGSSHTRSSPSKGKLHYYRNHTRQHMNHPIHVTVVAHEASDLVVA